MIRRLGEADRAKVIGFLEQSPQLNLYLLGNIDANGFDADFCEFWGDIVDGEVRGVVNRYMSGWTVFGDAAADWTGLGGVVDTHEVEAVRLQDNPGGIPSLLPYLRSYRAAHSSEEILMELPESGLRQQAIPSGFSIVRATLDDLPGLIALFADAGDMSRTPPAVERPLRDRRVWMALHGDQAVAAALTNAETERYAMVGGVFTLPEWRGRGLSQAVCSALCAELIEEGRRPVLYWDSPAAGHVYTKLGFRQIGTWRSLRLERI